MTLVILSAFVLLLAVLGLTDVFFFIKMCLFSPHKRADAVLFVFLDGGNSFLQLYTALQKRNWYGDSYCKQLVAVTQNLSKDEKLRCERRFANTDICFCDNAEDFYKKQDFGAVFNDG